jgi:TadE-like protein
MRVRRRFGYQRGSAMIEAVITIPVFLTLVFAMVDAGVGVYRQHAITQAARQGARQAMVHGKLALAGWNGGPWGPGTFGPTAANSTDPKAQAVGNYLAGIDKSQVQVQMDWLDGANDAEKRVRVTVTAHWTPMLVRLFGGTQRTMTAVSTMPIAH